MIVFQLWSDQHRRLPIDIFVFEPFNFRAVFEKAAIEPVAKNVFIRVLDLESLVIMKKEAGRDRDLIDVVKLEEIAKIRASHE